MELFDRPPPIEDFWELLLCAAASSLKSTSTSQTRIATMIVITFERDEPIVATVGRNATTIVATVGRDATSMIATTGKTFGQIAIANTRKDNVMRF